MLQLHQLKHEFGSTTLDYPDWSVDKGGHAAILGNSGSGKTTLLHLIGGLMKPTSGEVIVDDQSLAKFSGSSLDKFRGKNIGIVFQRPHLVKALSVRENLVLSQMLGGGSKDSSIVDELLDRLGIGDLKKRKIHQISQGQAQRVSIARALVNTPKLLLADEPTASLDDASCKKAIELLKDQANHFGAALIVATHDQRVKSEFENQLTL